jgi:prevent-host-death family protein
MAIRRMSSSKARNNLGSVLSTIDRDPESTIIVESYGEPKVAVISIDRFAKMRELELQEQQAPVLHNSYQTWLGYDDPIDPSSTASRADSRDRM